MTQSSTLRFGTRLNSPALCVIFDSVLFLSLSLISGVYADRENTARPIARRLLQQQGQGKTYACILVRVTSMGAAETVTKQISGLGCAIETTNAAQQERWAALEKEMIYVLLLGLALLFCAGMWKYAADVKQKPERIKQDNTLLWAGFSAQEVRGFHRTQTLFAVLPGLLLGILMAVILPHFLPDNIEQSVFTLSLWK